MSIRMSKPWQPLTEEHVARLPGQLGVFELARADGRIVYIGMAGGHSRLGLRGVIAEALADKRGGAMQFRVEVNQQYLTRYQELLMLHVADHGDVPEANRSEVLPRLGRLSPL